MPTILTLRLIVLRDTFLDAGSAPAQGWFLALLEAADPAWGANLHAPNAKRPYTVGPLSRPGDGPPWDRAFAGAGLRRGETWNLRIALLDDPRAAWLCGVLADIPLPRLGSAPVRLARCPTFTSEDPDVRLATWDALRTTPAAEGLRLSFETPTAFISGSDVLPIPAPERIWRSWRENWQAFAPEAHRELPDTESVLPLTRRYSLATHDITLKRGLFVGFTGWMDCAWRKGTPDDLRQAACALARLAEFTGTGAKTALGMGQTHVTFTAR